MLFWKQKINKIKNKNAALVTFLHGQSKNKITSEECFEIGKITAQLHEITKKFNISRKNNLSIESWQNIFEKIVKQKIDLDETIIKKTKSYLNFLKDKWPKNLPQGIIHADLFPDNIFFTKNKVSGIIDFYFACNDFFAYEIAICINSICFDNNSTFNMTKAKNLIDGYSSIRTLGEEEKKFLPILSMGAAMRFFLTRLHDFYHTDNKAEVRERILMFLLLNDGKTQREIAEFIGCSLKTVAHWCVHGDPNNIESLEDGRKNGNHKINDFTAKYDIYTHIPTIFNQVW